MKYFFFEIRYLCDRIQISGGQTQTLSIEMQLLNLKIHSLKRYLLSYTVLGEVIFYFFCFLLATTYMVHKNSQIFSFLYSFFCRQPNDSVSIKLQLFPLSFGISFS